MTFTSVTVRKASITTFGLVADPRAKLAPGIAALRTVVATLETTLDVADVLDAAAVLLFVSIPVIDLPWRKY